MLKNVLKIFGAVLIALLLFSIILCLAVSASFSFVSSSAYADEFNDLRSTSNMIGNPFFYSSYVDSETITHVDNNSPTYKSLGGWRPLNYSSTTTTIQSSLYSSSSTQQFAQFFNYPTSGNRYFCYPFQGELFKSSFYANPKYALYARFRCDIGTTFRMALYCNESSSTGFSSQVSGSLITKAGTGSWDTVSVLFESPFSTTFSGFLAPAIGCSANSSIDIAYVGFYMCPDGTFSEPYYRSDDYILGHQSGFIDGFNSGLSFTLSYKDHLFTDFQFTNPVANSNLSQPLSSASGWKYCSNAPDRFYMYSDRGYASLFGDALPSTFTRIMNSIVTPSLVCSNVYLNSFSSSGITFNRQNRNIDYQVFFHPPNVWSTDSFGFVEIFFLIESQFVLGLDIYPDYTLFTFEPYLIGNNANVPAYYLNLNPELSPYFYDLSVVFGRTDSQDFYQSGFDDGVISANNTIDTSSASYLAALDTIVPSSSSYIAGYNAGVNDSNQYSFYSLMDAVILSPVRMVQQILNFEILGTNMRDFFMGLITLSLVITVVGWILGHSNSGG